MDKTYKCRNGHKFKRVAGNNVICPTCNEPAEEVKWKTVDEFTSTRKESGITGSVSSIVNTIKEGIKKPFE